MKKSFLDSIDVPKPCEKSWDEMQGDDKSRFCSHCEKNIYNISAMTRQEAKKLLFQTDEKVCIRLERGADGRIKTLKKQLHQITRQMPLAAGVLTASLILSGANNAQETKVETAKITITQIADKNSKPTISGTVTDSNGAVIPGTKITLRNTKDNSIRATVSDREGLYVFKDVEASTYEVEVAEKYPFNKFIYKNVVVTEDKNFNLAIVLELQSGIETVGLVSFEAPATTEAVSIDTKITPRQIESLPVNPRNLTVLGLFLGTKEEKPKNQIKTSQISFTVIDSRKTAIPGAEVRLTHKETLQSYSVLTKDNGTAKFPRVFRGQYELFVSAPHFGSHKQILLIDLKREPNIEVSLEIRAAVGVSVIDWSEIPTFNAIVQDHFENVKKSINSGFNVNTKDSSGKTALHFAVEHGNAKIVRFLIAKGAKVNAKDRFGRTPLVFIDSDDEEHNFEILRLLIAKRADVNIRDKDENNATLLMNVCEDDNLEAVEILLKAGANPNLKDDYGETAIQKTNSDAIKKLLIKYGAVQLKKAETRP